ncbi:uncharacterized protein [Nicotiana sylvestris]|uniref:uncharacterized protein n=1 Tax=Nicotiana sylvestris TaxID=4096 RepID=UPI00388CC8DD
MVLAMNETTQKILKAGKNLTETRINIAEVMNGKKYSIREVYNKMRGEFTKVTWKRLICNNYSSPRCLFIMYIAVPNRLYTKDRLMKWGSITNAKCVLCEEADEDYNHLFFTCKYSSNVWEKVLYWAGIGRKTKIWSEEISWASKYATGRRSDTVIYRMILAGVVYYIWQGFNVVKFGEEATNTEFLSLDSDSV